MRRVFIAAALAVALVAVGTKVYAGTPCEGAAVTVDSVVTFPRTLPNGCLAIGRPETRVSL